MARKRPAPYIRPTPITESEREYWRRVNRPPSYRRAKADGGEIGPRTPEERAYLIKRYVEWKKNGYTPNEPLGWRERFPVDPAYKFNHWERVFICGGTYSQVRIAFDRVFYYCNNEEERNKEERTLQLVNERVVRILEDRTFHNLDPDPESWDSGSPSDLEDAQQRACICKACRKEE